MKTRWQTAHVQEDDAGRVKRVKAKPNLRLCGDPKESDVKLQVEKALTIHPRVALLIRVNSGAFEGEYTRKDGTTTRRYHEFCWVMSIFAPDVLKNYFPRFEDLAKQKLRVPDLIGMTRLSIPAPLSENTKPFQGGRFFAFEVKRRGKKATPGQAAFIDLVRACGGIAGVVYSADQAIEMLEAV